MPDVGFNLLADTLDAVVDLGQCAPVIGRRQPHAAQQFRQGHSTTSLTSETSQHSIFKRCEMNMLAPARHLLQLQIDSQSPKSNLGLGLRVEQYGLGVLNQRSIETDDALSRLVDRSHKNGLLAVRAKQAGQASGQHGLQNLIVLAVRQGDDVRSGPEDVDFGP